MKKYTYDVIDNTDRRLVATGIDRAQIAKLLNITKEWVDDKLNGLDEGRSCVIAGHTIFRSKEDAPPVGDSDKRLLLTEWDKVCHPFRILAKRSDGGLAGCR